MRQARTNWLDYSAVATGGAGSSNPTSSSGAATPPLFNVSPVRNLSPVTAVVAASSSSPQAPGAGLLQCRSTQSNVAGKHFSSIRYYCVCLFTCVKLFAWACAFGWLFPDRLFLVVSLATNSRWQILNRYYFWIIWSI